ncbi:MAG: NHL repeat-containing protein, partial [Phycisphaerae bacterium]|nr:NHL repeat-containing protein [Phycisphaerae bacterium]
MRLRIKVVIAFLCLFGVNASKSTASDYELLVASSGTNSIKRYSVSTGLFIDDFISAGSEGLSAPKGMVYGPDGNLYVCSYNNDRVIRYNGTTGAYMDVFVTSGFMLRQPTGLTFGPDGNLYVSSFNGTRVLRYNGVTGTYIDTFVTPSSGGLSGPMGLVFGPDGNLYVSSYMGNSVIRYNGTTGAYMDTFVPPGSGGLSRPVGLVFGPDGNLYVSSNSNDRINRYNGTTGAYMGIFNSGGPSPGRPTGLIFGPDGNSNGNDDLYVSSENNDQVLRYDGTTGVYIDQFVSSGSGGLDAPWGLVLKAAGPPLPPDNDECNQAEVISEAPFILSGLDVSAATTSVDDPCLSCGDSEFPQQSHSVWFTYTPPTNEWIGVSTNGSSYDTVLAIFTGDCNSNFTEVACDDNGGDGSQSFINLPVDGGVPLLIEVTSYGQQDANNLNLTLSNPSMPVHNITQNTYHSTIQSAINAAVPYDEIVVSPERTYHEHLVITGKNIILRSSDPNDPSVVAGTIIDGDLDSNSTTPEGPVIILAGFLEDCVIAGLTITGGGTDEYGGGIYGLGTHAAIRDCIITNNWAGTGGGIAACNGTIERCVISNNTSYIGGGIAYCDGRIERCIINRNTSRIGGGGLAYCDGYITNCKIANNSTEYLFSGLGGGLWMCDGVLNGCTIIGNTALNSGGIAHSNCSLTNCTVAWNSSVIPSPSIFLGSGDISNSIIWGNNPIDLIASTASYSLVQGGWPGEGNIDLDPLLTPDGHLRSGSPCINLGDPLFVIDPNSPNDIDAENRVMFGRIDIGSDEFLDTDGDGQPDFWERKYFGDPNTADPIRDQDGDQLKNLDEFELYSSNPYGQQYFVDTIDGNDSYDGHAPYPRGGGVGPKKTIQGGLNAVGDGDTVLVLPGGTYSGEGNYELDYGRKSVIVRREGNPISFVTIDCGHAGRAVDFESIKGVFAVLDGFMITNSIANIGGGIRTENSQFMFKDCVFNHNTAVDKAGGILCNLSSPTFSNVVFQHSNAPNEPDLGLIRISNINLQGDLTLEAGRLVVYSSWFYGPGRINLDEGTLLTVTGSMVISTDVNGPGDIYVEEGAELIIEGDAIVNLAHDTDPNLNGTIQCDGLLLVRDSVHLSNANIQVNRASFEGDVDISNSIITAEAGAPYGQFFIEDTVSIVGNDIHADGDRYMDLDPSVFAGVIANNRIFVTITEGIGNTRGGLLELRGLDGLFSSSSCDTNNEFFCEVNDVPVFDTNSWMIEELKVDIGAKVNLTNRFDFGNGGLYEVMYVKDLILEPNSVLN